MAHMGSYTGYQGHDLSVTTREHWSDGIVSKMYWVAVKEFTFTYHKIVNKRVSLL